MGVAPGFGGSAPSTPRNPGVLGCSGGSPHPGKAPLSYSLPLGRPFFGGAFETGKFRGTVGCSCEFRASCKVILGFLGALGVFM